MYTVQSRPKHGADGSGGDTVLPGTGLGNDTGFADAFGEECLADGVVDFVSTSMCQILTLEPDGGTASELGQTLGLVQRSRTADKVLSVLSNFGKEVGIVLDLFVCLLNLAEGFRKSFGDELSAKGTESLILVPCLDLLIVAGGHLTKSSGLILGPLLLITARS